MPRSRRSTLSDDRLLHLIARAVADTPLLADDAERGTMLALWDAHLPPAGVRVLAYCLMGTHVHVVVEREDVAALSTAMRTVCGAYARTVNARRGRTGDLFRDRFRALPFRDDAHLDATARYVERNPVAAGLVADPAAYRWSSFPYLVGLRPHPPRCLDVVRHHELLGGPERYAALVRDPDDHALLREAIRRRGVDDVLAAGWSQRAVAAALGVTQSAVARHARGGGRLTQKGTGTW